MVSCEAPTKAKVNTMSTEYAVVDCEMIVRAVGRTKEDAIRDAEMRRVPLNQRFVFRADADLIVFFIRKGRTEKVYAYPATVGDMTVLKRLKDGIN